ncbi:CHRD domain-containing protein [Novosphingobium naphthalenivorans]|uniref:CHRD domain-containing protein n=1 Tax=Novosphingobium naphthalenivorans TaxID=273168 RepID=UPI00082D0BDA|nr:CHRD domain-containing protein [Novosphingobium naphthalenivorans]
MKRLAILAALAGTAVPMIAIAPQALAADMATYHAALSGAQEVDEGDPDASAMAEVTVSGGKLCYSVTALTDLADATAAHIHKGARGENGPPVLPLVKSEDGGFKGCVDAPEWVADAMKDGFSGYYINVHNSEYPAGAIRGQLGQ